MRSVKTDRDILDTVQRGLDGVRRDVNKLFNVKQPTQPIYDFSDLGSPTPLNLPADPQEGQLALGTDDTTWQYSNGAWHRVGGLSGSTLFYTGNNEITGGVGTVRTVDPYNDGSQWSTDDSTRYVFKPARGHTAITKPGAYIIFGNIADTASDSAAFSRTVGIDWNVYNSSNGFVRSQGIGATYWTDSTNLSRSLKQELGFFSLIGVYDIGPNYSDQYLSPQLTYRWDNSSNPALTVYASYFITSIGSAILGAL